MTVFTQAVVAWVAESYIHHDNYHTTILTHIIPPRCIRWSFIVTAKHPCIGHRNMILAAQPSLCPHTHKSIIKQTIIRQLHLLPPPSPTGALARFIAHRGRRHHCPLDQESQRPQAVRHASGCALFLLPASESVPWSGGINGGCTRVDGRQTYWVLIHIGKLV